MPIESALLDMFRAKAEYYVLNTPVIQDLVHGLDPKPECVNSTVEQCSNP
jgi:hypothetical protein